MRCFSLYTTSFCTFVYCSLYCDLSFYWRNQISSSASHPSKMILFIHKCFVQDSYGGAEPYHCGRAAPPCRSQRSPPAGPQALATRLSFSARLSFSHGLLEIYTAPSAGAFSPAVQRVPAGGRGCRGWALRAAAPGGAQPAGGRGPGTDGAKAAAQPRAGLGAAPGRARRCGAEVS